MKATRPMTKSALAVARAALAAAAAALPAYASKFSEEDFTQHQLFAASAVREFLKRDHRGTEQLLRDWSDLRQALSLKRVPDHSALQKAHERLLKKRGPPPSSPEPSRRPARPA